jgi:hypothetical protein
MAKEKIQDKKKVQNETIFSAKEPLAKLLKEGFPVSVSIGLVTLFKVIGGHWQVIEDVRQGIIKKYGDQLPSGGLELIGPNDPDKRPMSKNWHQFVREYNELMTAETEIDFEKVNIPQFVTVKCDKCQHAIKKDLEISAETLMILEAFIEVEK